MATLLLAGPVQAAPEAPDGRALFDRHCAACHGSGPDKPGTVALATRYAGAVPAELAQRRDLTPDVVQAVVRGGIANMPPFRKVEISDSELDALGRWLAHQSRDKAKKAARR